MVSSDDSLQNIITCKEFYTIPALFHKNEEGKLAFDIYAKIIAAKIPTPPGNAQDFPLALPFPFTSVYNLQLNMPEEWPTDIAVTHIKNEWYQFDFVPVINGRNLIFKYYFKTFQDNIPTDQIQQYKSDYKKIDKCLSLWFTKLDLNSSPTEKLPGRLPVSNINYVTIWLCFLFGVLFTMLFRFMNKNSMLSNQEDDAGQPFRGWVIVLGITLLIRFAFLFYTIWNQHYFLKSMWVSLGEAGGVQLQSVFISEMITNLFALAGAGSLLYWYFCKRDIFPAMFIYYLGIILLLDLAVTASYFMFPAHIITSQAKQTAVVDFFRMLMYALIWGSFVRRSVLVKRTFIYPAEG